MQVRKQNVLLLIGALSFVAVFMSGCLKNVENTPPKKQAYFSFMHLAPRSPSVKIFFNDTEASGVFNPGQYTSYYSEVDPGIFAVNFKTTSGDSLVASLPTDVYDSVNFYTIVLYNTPDNKVQAFSTHDDYSVISDTKTCYRFFHMSPDIGDVDVYFNDEKWEVGRQYADNAFGSYYNQFQQKPGNSYNITVKKAGTDSVVAQTSTTLANYQAYTVFLKGTIGGTTTNELGIKVLQASTTP